jgi:hypothetical protein
MRYAPDKVVGLFIVLLWVGLWPDGPVFDLPPMTILAACTIVCSAIAPLPAPCYLSANRPTVTCPGQAQRLKSFGDVGPSG